MHNTDYSYMEMAECKPMHNSLIEHFNAAVTTKDRKIKEEVENRMERTPVLKEQSFILERYYVQEQLDAMPEQVDDSCDCNDTVTCCAE